MKNLSKREKILIRVFSGIIFIVVSFLVPWPIFLAVAALAFFTGRFFPEALAVGFMFDIIYGSPSAKLFGIRIFFTVAIVAIYFIVSIIRKRFANHRQ